MADIYVKNGATPTSPYNSWGTAADKLSVAAGIDAVGDTIYVSSSHTESTTTAQTIALAGTPANPVRVLCVNEDTPPITVVSGPTASVVVTGNAVLSITGSGLLEGISFASGGGVLISNNTANGSKIVGNNLILSTTNVGSAGYVSIGGVDNNSAEFIFTNLGLKFQAAGNNSSFSNTVIINSGYGVTGTATPSNGVFRTGGADACSNLMLNNFDFSNFTSTANIFGVQAGATGRFTIMSSELPTAWTGSLVTGTKQPGMRFSMYNCDSSNTNYRLWIEDYPGSIREDTGIYRDGGASDGTTNLSWKMVTNGNANELVSVLRSDPIAVWIDSTGSKTISIDIARDSAAAALKNSEVWLEVTALESASFPIGTFKTNKRATVLTSAVDQTTSTTTWTGLTSPTKQKLEVSFTQGMKGFVYATVCLAKPSTTLYVDYEPTVT